MTVLGNGRHLAVFPYAELEFKGEFADNWEVYTYEAKWVESSWEFWNVPVTAPARMGRKLDRRLERLVKKASRDLGVIDVVRFDIRVDQNERPFIVDVNYNPSLRRDDLDATWESVKCLGWSYADLIETVVAIAYKRVYGRLPDRIRERQLMLMAPSV